MTKCLRDGCEEQAVIVPKNFSQFALCYDHVMATRGHLPEAVVEAAKRHLVQPVPQSVIDAGLRKRHATVEEQAVIDMCLECPEMWFFYPWRVTHRDQLSSSGEITEGRFRSISNSIRNRCYTTSGPFGKTPGGRFRTRKDTASRSVWIRWEPANDE